MNYSIILNIYVEKVNNLHDVIDTLSANNEIIEVKENNLKRMIVNAIRHEYSNYETGLRKLHTSSKSQLEYYRYKNAVLSRISILYPELKNECNNQKHDVDMCKIFYNNIL